MIENDYIAAARKQMLSDGHAPLTDPILFTMAGLAEEAGECSCVKKLLRGDYPESEFKKGGPRHDALVKELGDAMWYLYMLIDQIGSRPEEVRRINNEKCADRHRRGVVRGDGDNR